MIQAKEKPLPCCLQTATPNTALSFETLGGRSGRTAMFGNPRTKPAIRSAWKSRSNVLRSAEVADH
jgi:hypothetical protein